MNEIHGSVPPHTRMVEIYQILSYFLATWANLKSVACWTNLWNPGPELKRTWLLVSFFGGWIGVGATSLVRIGDWRIQLFTTMLFVISEIWYHSSKYCRFSCEDHHPWDAELNMFSILVLVIFTGYCKTAKWSIKVASFVQQKHSIVSTQPRNPKRDKNHFFGGGYYS